LTSSNSFSDDSSHNIKFVEVKKEQGVTTTDTKETSKDKDVASNSLEYKHPESDVQHEECKVTDGAKTCKQKKGPTNGVRQIQGQKLLESTKGLRVEGILYSLQNLNGDVVVLEDVTLVLSAISELNSNSHLTENGNEN
jgi:hypothetical protein